MGAPMTAALTVLYRCLAVAAALAAAALAGLGALGAAVPVVDAVNHLAPFWLAGSVMALVVCLAGSRPLRLAAALALLACVYFGARIVPEVLAGAAARQQLSSEPWHLPSSGRPELTLVTFNMQGQLGHDTGQAQMWIRSVDPDVIAIQESFGSGAQLAGALADRWPHRHTCPARPRCNTVLLTQEPALRSSTGSGPSPGVSASWAVLPPLAGKDGQMTAVPVTLVSAHLAWPLDRPLGNTARIGAGEGVLGRLKALARHRPRQLRQMANLSRMVQTLGPDATILAGDFNSTPWAFAIDRMGAQAGLVRHTRALFSWPARPVFAGQPEVPVLPIDQVLGGRHWRAGWVVRGPALGSDHYPLAARLVWTGPLEQTGMQAPQPADAVTAAAAR
jgi:endonuclease/exonuclease/phosphatase (EEP) superfamily protein YafD